MNEFNSDSTRHIKASQGKIYFIAHGNEMTGAGHMIRSISLAKTFQKKGYPICFLSKYQQGITMVRKEGIEVISMPCKEYHGKSLFSYGSREELGGDITWIFRNLPEIADIIVVDSYNVSEDFFLGLRKLTKCLIYIDDLNAFPYPVDLLLNGTASAFSMGYEKNQTARLLLGIRYNLLRKQFYGIKLRKIKNEINDVLLTTGNSDPCHMTEKLLSILVKENCFSRFRYHVVIGGGFGRDIWLNSEIQNNRNITLYDQPDDMSSIMMKCDLAIAAGGTTLYELAACGVPAIAFAYADNQLPHIRALEDMRIIKYIGYYNQLNEKQLNEYIKYLMRQFSVREELIGRLQALVDGKGCERAVAEIEQYLAEKEYT